MIMSAFSAPQSTSGTPKFGPSVGSGSAPSGAGSDVEGVSSGMACLALIFRGEALTTSTTFVFHHGGDVVEFLLGLLYGQTVRNDIFL